MSDSIIQNPKNYPIEDVTVSRILESAEEGLDIVWDKMYDDELKGYNIYRSIVKEPYDTFERLNQDVVGTNFFRDPDADPKLRVIYWYRVVWVNSHDVEGSLELATPARLEFKATGWMANVLKEIRRRHAWILARDGFPNADIFIKKHAGDRCECWEPRLLRSSKGSSCEKCLGTGLIGGYHKIADQVVRVRSPREKLVEGKTGLRVVVGPTALLAPYPPIYKEDLVRLKDGSMYLVGEVVRRQVQGEQTLQVATIELLPPSHQLYRSVRQIS